MKEKIVRYIKIGLFISMLILTYFASNEFINFIKTHEDSNVLDDYDFDDSSYSYKIEVKQKNDKGKYTNHMVISKEVGVPFAKYLKDGIEKLNLDIDYNLLSNYKK